MISLGVLCYALLYVAFFLLVEVWKRRAQYSAEFTRPIVHVGCSVLTATMPYYLVREEVILLGVAFVGLLALTKYLTVFTSVQGVRRKTVGEFTFAASAIIAAWVFLPDQPVAFVVGFAVLGISDTSAQVVGRLAPIKVVRVFGQQKSLGGFLAFFSLTLAIFWIAARFTGSDLSSARWLAAAFLLALIESSQVFGLDNLFIPAAAGLCWDWLLVSA